MAPSLVSISKSMLKVSHAGLLDKIGQTIKELLGLIVGVIMMVLCAKFE